MTFEAEAVDEMVDPTMEAVEECTDEKLEELRDEYDGSKDTAILKSIAECYESLGQLGSAIGYYQNYLLAAKDATDRGDVEARISNLKAKRKADMEAAGKGFLKVSVNVSGAKITVDDEEVGKSPMKKKIPLAAGLYEVGAKAGGFPDFLGTAMVKDGETTELDIELKKEKKFPVAAVIIGVGAAVAVGVVVGVIVGVSNRLPTPTLGEVPFN